ncbi:MAG: DNA-3-methyladenine glycosylase [Gemmatimonadota bacterium]|nr:DNA-3-methyladenine glycosylase [Gemmatimonadota bacterium]
MSVALTPKRLKQAAVELSAADEKLARVIEVVGPCTMVPKVDGSHFDHLTRNIVYQQLSGAAAGTIHGRFIDRCGGGKSPTPEHLLTLDDASLRGCGLSSAKVAAIRDLAVHVSDRRLPLDAFETMDDAAIIASLVAVRGIGVWTAQMFLMFRLGRPDVLPVLDLGVRKGAQRIYRMRKLPDATRLEKVAKAWRPWRSVASWYCWRVLDLENVGGW